MPCERRSAPVTGRNLQQASRGKARVARDVHLIYLRVDAKWDAFRSDPRFQEFLQRCGLGRA